MKKLLVLLLVVFVALSVCSCGSDNSIDNDADNNETTIKNDISEDIDVGKKTEESSPEDFIGIDTAEGYFIDEYKGTAKKVIVPDELDGKKVVGIEIDAFNNVEIEEIVMPSGLEKIQKSTFAHATSLKKVVLNEGLKSIGKDAFFGCRELLEINIPSTVTDIGNAAFCSCEKLSKLTLNEGLQTMGYTVFGGCPIEVILVPSTVKSIGSQCFSNNDVLKELRFLCVDAELHKYVIDECPNATIYGYAGSTAESVANSNGIPFVAIDG